MKQFHYSPNQKFSSLPVLEENDSEALQNENEEYPEFNDLPNLNEKTKLAISDMELKKMTEIQYKTFGAASNGQDVLGRARTGTGKTLAFLLPTIEKISREKNSHAKRNRNVNSSISAIIISPTRELATQIGEEAYALLKYNRNISVQIMFGGVKKHLDLKRLNRRLPSILVATPGRLKDHLQSTYVHDIPFSDIICQEDQQQILILDETDRLLDMGFKDDINEIISYLPPKSQRQTLLFSATMPSDLRKVMKNTMNENHVVVDCIRDQDPATHTSTKVDQYYVVLPSMERYVSGLVEIMYKAIQEDPANHKIIVFFPTAMMVKYFSHLFNHEMNHPVFEIHAKKTQNIRTKVSKQFKQKKSGILFTTDVSARGVDYPDVTHVIQFGLPENRETYIHRLGRTGRAGKNGKGWLVLAPFETSFLQKLKDMDVTTDTNLKEMLDQPVHPNISSVLDPIISDSRDNNFIGDLGSAATKAYQSMIGFYASKIPILGKNFSKADLIRYANEFSFYSGLDDPPELNGNLMQKLGFKNVPGLRINQNSFVDKENSNRNYQSSFNGRKSRSRYNDRKASDKYGKRHSRGNRDKLNEW